MALSRINAKSIADGTIVASDIADGSITTAKIADGNVTAAKVSTIANTQLTGTITSAQLGTGAVSNTKIASGAVEQYFADTGYQVQFRNRIINGDMRIAQRGTSAVTANDSYPVDRMNIGNSTDGAFSAIQDSDVPAGFNKSVKFTITTADASVTGTQSLFLTQPIEGLNVADLNWGTANAKTVTLSFWVRSSVTGTFSGSLVNNATDRSYPFTYAISSANTWEYKTVTIAGDTTGTWVTDNNVGIRLYFSLGTGSTRLGTAGTWGGARYHGATGETALVNTLNATWYVTGVQLEVGSVATPFERRPYGTELSLCQRYFERLGSSSSSYGLPTGYTYQSAGINYLYFPGIPLLVEKRAAPTLTFTSGNTTFFNGIYGTSNTGATLDAVMTGSLNATTTTTKTIGFYQNTTSTSGASAGSALLGSINQNQFVSVSAEL